VFWSIFLAFPTQAEVPQAFILLPLGMLVIWLLNAIRVASLILVGAHVRRRLPWVASILNRLDCLYRGCPGMVVITQRMPFSIASQPTAKAENQKPNLTALTLAR